MRPRAELAQAGARRRLPTISEDPEFEGGDTATETVDATTGTYVCVVCVTSTWFCKKRLRTF